METTWSHGLNSADVTNHVRQANHLEFELEERKRLPPPSPSFEYLRALILEILVVLRTRVRNKVYGNTVWVWQRDGENTFCVMSTGSRETFPRIDMVPRDIYVIIALPAGGIFSSRPGVYRRCTCEGWRRIKPLRCTFKNGVPRVRFRGRFRDLGEVYKYFAQDPIRTPTRSSSPQLLESN